MSNLIDDLLVRVRRDYQSTVKDTPEGHIVEILDAIAGDVADPWLLRTIGDWLEEAS